MTDIIKIRNEYVGKKENVHQIAIKMGLYWATVNSYVKKTEEEIKCTQTRPNRVSKIGNDEVRKAIRDYFPNGIIPLGLC